MKALWGGMLARLNRGGLTKRITGGDLDNIYLSPSNASIQQRGLQTSLKTSKIFSCLEEITPSFSSNLWRHSTKNNSPCLVVFWLLTKMTLKSSDRFSARCRDLRLSARLIVSSTVQRRRPARCAANRRQKDFTREPKHKRHQCCRAVVSNIRGNYSKSLASLL